MEYIIDEKYDGVRVDRFLKKTLPNTVLAEIFKGLKNGNIRVNGKKTKENSRLALGDIVSITRVVGEPLNSEEEKNKNRVKLSSEEIKEVENSIIFENEKIIIINKKANFVMHKGSGHDYGLSEMLKTYLDNDDFAFVNRIDKATSGMVIGAKTLPAARELSEEIRENKIDKRYYIIVEGIINKKEFTQVTYLKKIEDKVIELKEFEQGAKESISHFKVLKTLKSMTLLVGQLDSGRTHQLRVQLSSIGHPIMGDYKYGAKKRVKRMMLHSFYLEIPKYNLKFELPIPDEFEIS
ncbi:MAG: RluA family pseudouridine synthase [Fusobacteriaceae bacterium]